MSPRRIAILGSTGSIGCSALEVAAAFPDRVRVVGLTAHSRLAELCEQSRHFAPRWLVATDEFAADRFDWSPLSAETEVWRGHEGIEQLVRQDDVELVIAAIVGSAGLRGTWAALEAGKVVALANKETLVMAGPQVMHLAAERGGRLLPVDSEHCAVFQALLSGKPSEVRRVVLTASGGPFLRHTESEMASVTVDDALAHPTWKMGRKITIDSATMMNKALEVVEACWLFGLGPEQVEVVIHPQSIVHSMVEFVDGSLIAQLSPPDMKLPIQYALSYPDRWEASTPHMDLSVAWELNFEPPDRERFPALELGYEVAQRAGTAGAVVNAANEAAVASFLDGQLSFQEIVPACRAVLEHHDFDARPGLEQLIELDEWAREEGYTVGLCLMAQSDWQANIDWLLMLAQVAIGLGFVIFVHELGHFLVAKMCGVKCEKFYVGFDVPIKIGPLRLPSKLAKFQWGETEYGVGILPLGGYVKMLGQDDDPRNTQKEAERIRVQKSEPGERETAARDEESEFELDPRSFPAKPVPQRMAIISAGVIMNLIFAVIFAGFAFSAGVPYTPTEIGGTVPGSPAWEARLEPGSRIIQIGRQGRRSERLRFDWDLSQGGVGLAQDNEDLELLLRKPDGEEEWVTLRPVMTQKLKAKIPMIGVAPAKTLQVGTVIGQSKKPDEGLLKGGDRILSVDGTSVQAASDLDRLLAAQPTEPLQIRAERPVKDRSSRDGDAGETVEVTLPANKFNRLGLWMRFGPVNALLQGSPADLAGIRVGDQITAVAGEPVQDPMLLENQLRPYYGQQIDLQVQRGDELLQLPITPTQPLRPTQLTAGFPLPVEALGLTFDVSLEVAGLQAGSPAAEAGMLEGDVLTGITFETPEKPPQSLLGKLSSWISGNLDQDLAKERRTRAGRGWL